MDAGSWAGWIGGVGLPLATIVVGAFIRSLKERITEARTEAAAADKKAQKALGELQAYKLEVAEKYAPVGYLKDVEARILGALDEIKKDFKDFVKEYHANRPAE